MYTARNSHRLRLQQDMQVCTNDVQLKAVYIYDSKRCCQSVECRDEQTSPDYKIIISIPIIVIIIVICNCCYRQVIIIIPLILLVVITAIAIVIIFGIFCAGNTCHAAWGLYMRCEGDICTRCTQAIFSDYTKADVFMSTI